MAIFGQRSQQHMLNELGPWLNLGKAKDLQKRLTSSKSDKPVPAEYELALQWGVSQIANIDIEPEIGGKKPDFCSLDLLPDGPVVVEITALSDLSLSRKKPMRDAVSKIGDASNKILRNSSKHLYYIFLWESGYEQVGTSTKGLYKYFRRQRISTVFKVDHCIESLLKSWLINGRPSSALRLETTQIGVIIEWREAIRADFNFHCGMPSEADDLKDNCLYQALRDKYKNQLQKIAEGTKKAIFLGDSGCSLLNVNFNPPGGGFGIVSGQRIIEKFLQDYDVDFVVVFTPRKDNQASTIGKPIGWSIFVLDRLAGTPSGYYDRVLKLENLLPRPRLHGDQAHALAQWAKGDYSKNKIYLQTQLSCTKGKTPMTARISARALQELISGRISAVEFKNIADPDSSIFEFFLNQGRTITATRFESKGHEEDDDYIVLEFSDIPAAAALELPKPLKDG